MSDESIAVGRPLHRRVRHGLRHPDNWWQLVRFGVVGGSGYLVNLVTFTLSLDVLGVNYRLAAVIAFCVGVTNNFWWNRHWTFGARDGHAAFQVARFTVVSLGAFALSLGVLELLVSVAGLGEVLAQAIAVVAATPFSFLGNKLWSFSR